MLGMVCLTFSLSWVDSGLTQTYRNANGNDYSTAVNLDGSTTSDWDPIDVGPGAYPG